MEHLYIPSRYAILLGAPSSGKDFLRGVRMDLANYRTFLRSESGGAWLDNEIYTLDNPTYEEVLNLIQSIEVDYLHVYFSGHGYTDPEYGRMLCFKNGDIPDTWLIGAGPRQMILVDACRDYKVHPGISGIPQYQHPLFNFDGSPSQARILFDQHILLSPAGVMIIHGTAEGYSSSDTPDGGRFTLAVLRAVVKKQADQYIPISIHEVIENAQIELLKGNKPQYPSIYVFGSLTVPFAIGVPPRDSSRDITVYPIPPRRPPFPTGGWILLGIATFLLISAATSD